MKSAEPIVATIVLAAIADEHLDIVEPGGMYS
jgi:hypothetical protein